MNQINLFQKEGDGMALRLFFSAKAIFFCLLILMPLSSSAQSEKTFLNVDQLADEALQNNPEILAAKKKWEVFKEKIPQAYALAKREYYPDFNFRFPYGQRDNSPDMKRRDMLTGMMEINIPIFYKSKQDRKVVATHPA
jgi:outer membrane protein TolC